MSLIKEWADSRSTSEKICKGVIQDQDENETAKKIIENSASYSDAYGKMLDAGMDENTADYYWLKLINQCGANLG